MSRGEHEHTDVSVRGIFWAFAVLAIFAAFAHAQIWLFFDYFRNLNADRDERRSLIEAVPQEPPAPRLQVDPAEDWVEYSRRQKEELNTYGWTSRERERVRIPIERAMELLEEQGSPRPPESEESQ